MTPTYLDLLLKSFVVAADNLGSIWLIIDLKKKFSGKRNKLLSTLKRLLNLIFNNYKPSRFWIELNFIYPKIAQNRLSMEYKEILEAEIRYVNL